MAGFVGLVWLGVAAGVLHIAGMRGRSARNSALPTIGAMVLMVSSAHAAVRLAVMPKKLTICPSNHE